jgi:hypothetical protein
MILTRLTTAAKQRERQETTISTVSGNLTQHVSATLNTALIEMASAAECHDVCLCSDLANGSNVNSQCDIPELEQCVTYTQVHLLEMDKCRAVCGCDSDNNCRGQNQQPARLLSKPALAKRGRPIPLLTWQLTRMTRVTRATSRH